MSHHEHEAQAPASLRIAVLTLSDTRTEAEDRSGAILKDELLAAGHQIVAYRLIREDPEGIEETLRAFLALDVDAVITNGGTGLTARDGTIEVARRLLQKELPGFGELFRALSFQQIGAAALLSRATAGLANGKILVCLPGSSKGVRLALRRILLNQLPHMVWEAGR